MARFFSPSPLFLATGIALVRIITGIFLIYHGWEVFDKTKMIEYATWDVFKNTFSSSFFVYAGKTTELVAGFLLVFGLLTRVASVIIICTFLYISFFIGHGKIWYEDQHPFLFVLLTLVFFVTGPGRWSIDHLLFKQLPRKN